MSITAAFNKVSNFLTGGAGQAGEPSFNNRSVSTEGGSTLKRVALAVVTLGVSELVRALRDRNPSVAQTQPSDALASAAYSTPAVIFTNEEIADLEEQFANHDEMRFQESEFVSTAPQRARGSSVEEPDEHDLWKDKIAEEALDEFDAMLTEREERESATPAPSGGTRDLDSILNDEPQTPVLDSLQKEARPRAGTDSDAVLNTLKQTEGGASKRTDDGLRLDDEDILRALGLPDTAFAAPESNETSSSGSSSDGLSTSDYASDEDLQRMGLLDEATPAATPATTQSATPVRPPESRKGKEKVDAEGNLI